MATIALTPENSSQANHQLNPILQEDPFTTLTTCKRWSRVWTVLALGTAASFIAFSVGAYIYTAAQATAQLLVYIAIVTIGLQLSFKAFKFMWDKSGNYKKEADLAQKIIKRMNALSDQDVQNKVRALGIIIPGNMEPLQLKYLLAKYQHIESLKESALQKEKENSRKQGFTENDAIRFGDSKEKIIPIYMPLTDINWEDEKQLASFKFFQRKCVIANDSLQEAAEHNLNAAYLLKVMEDPYAKEQKTYLKNWIPLNFIERGIARQRGCMNAFTLLSLSDGTPLSVNQVVAKSTIDLAHQVFHVAENEKADQLNDTGTE